MKENLINPKKIRILNKRVTLYFDHKKTKVIKILF